MLASNRPPVFDLFAALFIMICSCNQQQAEENKPLILPDQGNGGISLPVNFGAVVVADTLGRARHLVVSDNGDVYVHLMKLNNNDKGIIALRDTDNDGRADLIKDFSEVAGTGIEMHNGYLYFSSRTEVYRAKMQRGELLPLDPLDTLVHLVDGTGHMEKPFTFDNQGNMYVNIGSSSNACQKEQRSKGSPGIQPCTELETRAGIWRFSDNQMNQQQTLDKRYATGIRNAVALAWNFDVNELYAVQHGRDDLHRFWPEYYTEKDNLELPAEEFIDIEEGDNFGWPYCYYDQFKKQLLLNPEYGGNGEITGQCEDAKMPLIGFPGHWAPNDLLFYKGNQFPEKYKHGAFIAFHGSWNRLGSDQAGFNVVFIPMDNGGPAGDWEVFADGFVGPNPVENPGNALYRPCGLAEGPDGSLYISDDQKGRIWRVMYYQDGIPGYKEQAVTTPTGEESKSEMKTETEAEITTDQSLQAGKEVFDTYCMACHMTNGKGAPGMNPPLVDTKYVLGDKERLITIILNGLTDQVEIKGEIYQNIMAPHNFLTNQQIADVLSYIRNSWGNDASKVTPEEVAEVRAKQ